jgi:hypothetical protein
MNPKPTCVVCAFLFISCFSFLDSLFDLFSLIRHHIWTSNSSSFLRRLVRACVIHHFFACVMDFFKQKQHFFVFFWRRLVRALIHFLSMKYDFEPSVHFKFLFRFV